jgi:outer membrane protein TolC
MVEPQSHIYPSAAGRLLLAVFLSAACWAGAPAHAEAQSATSAPDDAQEASPLHVAVVADPGPAADSLVRRIRAETEALFAGRRPVRFTRQPAATPWTVDAVQTAHDRVLARSPDALVVVGPVSTNALCFGAAARGSGRPPTVATATESSLLLPQSTSASCAVVEPGATLKRYRNAFQRIQGQAITRLHVMVDARVAAVLPGASQSLQERAEAAGLSVRLVPVRPGQEVDSVVGHSSGRPAALLAHLDRWSPEDVRALTQQGTAQSLPVYALSPTHVEQHRALAAPERKTPVRARRIAVALEQKAGPGSPQADRSAYAASQRAGGSDAPPLPLVVNRSVAQAQGLSLPWSVRVDARLVGAPTDSGAVQTLAAAMRESIQSNLALRAERQRTSAQANQVAMARSRLLPQVTARATGRNVSSDVAAASFGSQPERELSSSLSFRQVLFSEPAFAALSVERRKQAMRAFETQSVRLDAAQRAADAYLGVLQARAAVAIQRENVRAVRTNLRAARSRQQAGAADPRAVSRLETQEARAEQGLLRALGRVRTAELRYNRVLDRPLDAPVRLDQEVGVDPRPVLEQFPYDSLLTQTRRADAFRTFWVREARSHAPEVQAVNQLVRARERQAASTKRSFWLPTISLQGQFSQRMIEGGQGTSGLDLPLPNADGSAIPTPPDQQWSIGVTASFPLFSGAERAAKVRQADHQLAAAQTRRMIAQTGVEQDVRTALIELETSREAVERALRAAEAAQRTLDVTQAAYRQGTASLVDLIDAQSTALTTRQEASRAAYGLLRDWIGVQRAGGSFRALRTPEEQRAFLERLRQTLPGDSLPVSVRTEAASSRPARSSSTP